jgi:hypothetical protein
MSMTIKFLSTNQELPFIDCISKMLITEQKECVKSIATIIYNIWRARILQVLQNKYLLVMEVVQQAMASSKEYKKLCRSQRSTLDPLKLVLKVTT